jgi:hypothetical protein
MNGARVVDCGCGSFCLGIGSVMQSEGIPRLSRLLPFLGDKYDHTYYTMEPLSASAQQIPLQYTHDYRDVCTV